VQLQDVRLGNSLASCCDALGLVECGVITFDLILVSLPSRKVFLRADHLCDLFLSQAVSFDHRRVVGGKETGRFTQVCQYTRCDRKRLNGLLHGFDPHQAGGDGRRDGEGGAKNGGVFGGHSFLRRVPAVPADIMLLYYCYYTDILRLKSCLRGPLHHFDAQTHPETGSPGDLVAGVLKQPESHLRGSGDLAGSWKR
jgi:hypothetical protein